MPRDDEGVVFTRVTAGLRKPSVRMQLANGRRVELLSFHLEPGYCWNGKKITPIFDEVAARLFYSVDVHWVTEPAVGDGDGFLCIAYFCSDTPTTDTAIANASYLLLGSFIQNINHGVQGIVSDMLSAIVWETTAEDEFVW